MNLVQMCTVAAGTYHRVLAAVRLRRVRVWGNPAGTGATAQNISVVEWKSNFAPSVLIQDMSSGITGAHIDTKPPVNSSAAWWSINGSNETEELFGLSCARGDVVEIETDVVLIDTEAPVVGDGANAGTLGQMYGGYLDGLTSKIMLPQGYVALP